MVTRRMFKIKKNSYKNKKHHYKLKDPLKRKLAIHEGVNMEAKKLEK